MDHCWATDWNSPGSYGEIFIKYEFMLRIESFLAKSFNISWRVGLLYRRMDFAACVVCLCNQLNCPLFCITDKYCTFTLLDLRRRIQQDWSKTDNHIYSISSFAIADALSCRWLQWNQLENCKISPRDKKCLNKISIEEELNGALSHW